VILSSELRSKQDPAQPTRSGEGLKEHKNTIALVSLFRK